MMDREEYEEEMKIYSTADPINQHGVSTETNKARRQQKPQHTGSDSVKMKSSRSAPVCLALLCFLLMTAVVVLRLYFCTNNTNRTYERNQLLTRITNNTEERDELLTRITNLTKERDELLTRNSDVTKERDQLRTRNSDVTKERDQLRTKNNDVTKERDQLRTRNSDITKERDQLRTKNMQLSKEKDELSSNNHELSKQRDLLKMDGWIFYKSSFYFISSEEKSWTESRTYCTERGADLIIINNSEEQDFVEKIVASAKVWIGLNDKVVEDRWKWVDDSAMTIGFWHDQEPNGGIAEDCVLNHVKWADYACNLPYQWICEKNIFK